MRPGFHNSIGEYRQLARHGLTPPQPSHGYRKLYATAASGLLHRGKNIIAPAGVTLTSVEADRRHFEALPSRCHTL